MTMSKDPRRPTPPPPGGHIVIIGAGASGGLTAVMLAEAGFKVTIIDKGAPGNGSSSRSAAAIRAQFGVRDTVLGMIYSEHYYANFHHHMGTPAEQATEPAIIQNGYLFIYEDPAGFHHWTDEHRAAVTAWETAQKNVAMQQELGLPVELLTMEEVEERWPHLNGEETYRFIGATWCPTDGFLRHDLVYNRAIARARELGVTVMLRTEIIGSIKEDGSIKAIRVVGPDGLKVIECDAVVNCTNAWASRVSQVLGGSALGIAPTKRYLTVVKKPEDCPVNGAWDKLPFTIYGMQPAVYSRPESGGLMIGCAHATAPHWGFTDEDQDRLEDGFAHSDSSKGVPYAAYMRALVAQYAPDIAGGSFEGTTCGFYGVTGDSNPYIDWDPACRGLFHAAGFSGHGLMHAPITALLVTAHMTGQVTEDGMVQLPPLSDDEGDPKLINAATFAIDRDFSANHESAVL